MFSNSWLIWLCKKRKPKDDEIEQQTLNSAHPRIGFGHKRVSNPEMAIFPAPCARLGFQSPKYFNVFLWLKSSSSLTLPELSYFWMNAI
jgi:hypothetical protein